MIQQNLLQNSDLENNDFVEQNFQGIVTEGLKMMNSPEFEDENWNWIRELEEEGIFIFSYLLFDYRNNTLNRSKLEETVYMLSMIMHKMVPPSSKSGISKMGEYQVILTLYEKLKKDEMSWEACESFISKQILEYKESN